MLGNHADAFFTTPMRTSVVRGGNSRPRNTMPMPYEGGSRTRQVTMAGMGDDPSSPVTADPGDIFSQIANATQQVQNVVTPPPAPKPKTNWLLYGGIAVAVAVAFGALKAKKA